MDDAVAAHDLRPDSCYHYEYCEDVPRNIQKYWKQRHTYFSLFDHGIWLTDAAWYGVTPEPIARTIAEHLAQACPSKKNILVDAFAGVGGNTIQFALSGRWRAVIAVEKDPDTLQCLKHNARIYGVAEKIVFMEQDVADIFKVVQCYREEAFIFASPPWGGPGYNRDAVFDASKMEPFGLDDLCNLFQPLADMWALYLPRNTNLEQLAEYARPGEKLEVKHYCMAGASKAMCVYFDDRQKSQ